ncbi:MAG TPA: hypothetical protein VK545_20415 [Streptomyces sp.]|nr:hypothetical protein [Streptomyces sp.]
MTDERTKREDSAKIRRALWLRDNAVAAAQEVRGVDLADAAAVARVIGKVEALLLMLGEEVCTLVEASTAPLVERPSADPVVLPDAKE